MSDESVQADTIFRVAAEAFLLALYPFRSVVGLWYRCVIGAHGENGHDAQGTDTWTQHNTWGSVMCVHYSP